MRRARSSVDEAPSRSPWDTNARAWATSELVAGDRRFARGGGAGGGGTLGDAGLALEPPCGPDAELFGASGRNEAAGQPPSSSATAHAAASLVNARYS